ncbi:MAG: sugar ABC transporter ATPase [Paraburkholderia sp.]|uniref:sugar ABC transporter ATPase n=1 Tax=Paraburkholderia sp. TaxID=1926495 RepID=UPI001225AE39|nr:sugar ABC transporter ATPase [Paraburkholderia sp.]TAL98506.1 MAG: sugar ABC transporter ATPase [Paraburkholderia sp.]
MKRLLLLLPVAVLAACGSSGSTPKTGSTGPMMYFSSHRSTADITSCLVSRLSRVKTSGANGSTELTVGSSSHSSYFVTLTPSGHGSVIKVLRPDDSQEDPPEPELRFDIARCAV